MILQGIENTLIRIIESGMRFQREGEPHQRTGLLLGTATQPYDRRKWEQVFLPGRDRLKHIYVLGATGTGKSKLIESFIRQDILENRGCALLDPHGDLCQNILRYLASIVTASRDRLSIFEYLNKKLVLVEPFNQQSCIGFNPLEARDTSPFSLAVELIKIFRKIWQGAYWGPRMEELFRCTLTTLSENNLTLLEAVPLLTDPSFREKMMEKLTGDEVRDYWLYRYNPLSEAMKGMFRDPVLNRISVFTSDPNIRLMVGQARSTIDFRKIMDGGKWLIINLSKGHMRENIYLLGGLLIAKLKMAAITRVDLSEERRRLFTTYIDEFQNFGEDFQSILPEARKYGLSLCLAHQNLDQVDKELLASILANAATQIIFRISHHDSVYLSSELDPREKPMIERKLIDFQTGQAYLKRKGEKPRLLRTTYVSPLRDDEETIDIIRDLSVSNFARPRREIMEEITQRRNSLYPREGFPRTEGRVQPRFTFQGEMEEGWDNW